MDDWFLLYTPFFFITLSSILLVILKKIKKIKKRWELDMLTWIPFSIMVLYSWVAFFNPPIEHVRLGVRWLFGFGLVTGIYIAKSYFKELKNRGKF